jgi:hypothetical protein
MDGLSWIKGLGIGDKRFASSAPVLPMVNAGTAAIPGLPPMPGLPGSAGTATVPPFQLQPNANWPRG